MSTRSKLSMARFSKVNLQRRAALASRKSLGGRPPRTLALPVAAQTTMTTEGIQAAVPGPVLPPALSGTATDTGTQDSSASITIAGPRGGTSRWTKQRLSKNLKARASQEEKGSADLTTGTTGAIAKS
jgi:hypothetical protein